MIRAIHGPQGPGPDKPGQDFPACRGRLPIEALFDIRCIHGAERLESGS